MNKEINFKGSKVINIRAHVEVLQKTREMLICATLDLIMKEIEGEDYMSRIEDIKPKIGKRHAVGVFGGEIHYTYEGVVILIDPIDLRQPLKKIYFKEDSEVKEDEKL